MENESNNWLLLSTYQFEYKASILVGSLENEGIEYKIENKVDNAFNFMGKVEIYVRQSDFVKALHLKENIDL
ncbi:MAG: DUF2007 domain-containing protein [Chitinophagales bacterium]|nr:DUF2007 domain-containing protein [Chitinophagales bacterium]